MTDAATQPVVTVWITKWWQTRGIQEFTQAEPSSDDPRYVFVGKPLCYFSVAMRYGIDAFRTRKGAEVRVRALAKKRVQMLRAQAAAIEARWLP